MRRESVIARRTDPTAAQVTNLRYQGCEALIPYRVRVGFRWNNGGRQSMFCANDRRVSTRAKRGSGYAGGTVYQY